MTETKWSEVDAYIVAKLSPAEDPLNQTLDAALTRNRAAGLPAIDVSPAQGKLLHLLARLAGARKILEIGTLGGYSTIWLARALPGRRENRHAGICVRPRSGCARKYFRGGAGRQA